MPRCRSQPLLRPLFNTTLFLFRGESVSYPSVHPSICSLVRWIEALGYVVDVHYAVDVHSFQSFPSNFWGVAVAIIEDTILFIVPLPGCCRLLTRSRDFFGEA